MSHSYILDFLLFIFIYYLKMAATMAARTVDALVLLRHRRYTAQLIILIGCRPRVLLILLEPLGAWSMHIIYNHKFLYNGVEKFVPHFS